jgi:hypothetical protein
MRGRAARVAVVLLLLALLWVGLPVPFTYVGSICNYDVRSWGLYGWVKEFCGESIFGRQSHTVYPAYGLAITVVASALAAAAGGLWSRGGRGQRAAGLLLFLAPAALLVAQLLGPAAIGVNGGGGGDYFYYRGQFGYLVEQRETFEPPGFPPYELPITGPVRLDLTGLAITVVTSVSVLAIAGWLGSRAGRWERPGPPPDMGGTRATSVAGPTGGAADPGTSSTDS